MEAFGKMTLRNIRSLYTVACVAALGLFLAGYSARCEAAAAKAGAPPAEAAPRFDAVFAGPYPTEAARDLALRGPQQLLLAARAGETVSARIRPSVSRSPVKYRFVDPLGRTVAGELKENVERTLAFPVSAAGTCQLLLDTDDAVSTIAIDPARPAVIRSPVRLRGGARLYFHVPAETAAVQVFLAGRGRDAHGRLDLFDSRGRHVAAAATDTVPGDATLARVQAAVPAAEAGKTWYVLVRGAETGTSYQDATLSFGPEIPPYVALAPETLMREQEFAAGELAAVYGPFVAELRRRIAKAPAGTAGAKAWRAKLSARIGRLDGTLAAARTFEAQEQIREELLSVDALASALAAGRLGFDRCVVRVVKAISDRRILPDVPFSGGVVGGPLLLAATPGEHESGSFVVSAEERLDRLTARCEGLVSAAGDRLAASNVSIRAVKAWYQDTGSGRPGNPHGGYDLSLRSGKTALVPELLLHDDALVRVDTAKRQNFLRVGKGDDARYVCVSGKDPVPGKTRDDFYVADAPALLPLDLPAGMNKQFWVTVHVPREARAGIYAGALRLSCGNRTLGTLPFKTRVLPFKLAPPRRIAGIYYYAPDRIYYGSARMAQFRKELENLHAHSIDDVTMPFNVLEEPEAYALRRSVLGDRASRVFYTGWPTQHARSAEDARANVVRHLEALRTHGVETAYFYGLDEAEGEKLTAQRAIWDAVRAAGGKIYVAGYPTGYPGREDKPGNFELMGDIQDMLVCAWEPSLAEARRWHGKGHLIVSYANPQAGIELPDLYRRNFGLTLWKNEYDGAMTYLYHWGASYAQDWGNAPGERRYFPSVWNDECRKDRYRQHNMVYPTADGVIDTLQWEGYREAADDLRYIDTLSALVEAAGDAPTQPRPRRSVAAARAFLSRLKARDFGDPQLDMDAVRADIIDHILALHAAAGGGR